MVRFESHSAVPVTLTGYFRYPIASNRVLLTAHWRIELSELEQGRFTTPVQRQIANLEVIITRLLRLSAFQAIAALQERNANPDPLLPLT